MQCLASHKDLTALVESYDKHFKAIADLVKAIRSAHSELYQARLDHDNLAAHSELAAKKAADKRQKMLAASEA
eukprot:8862998-Alexandrium_andersonii.AAC.1